MRSGVGTDTGNGPGSTASGPRRALSVRLAARLFELALPLLPRGSRRLLADDLTDMFEHLATRAHRSGGTLAVAGVWWHSVIDLLRQARRERREPPVPLPPRNRAPLQRNRTSAMKSLGTDLRHAALGLRKSPAYTAVVLATLALGIGAVTAIFSLVNAVLIAPLSYVDADRIVVFWGAENGIQESHGTLAYLNFIDVRAASRSFEVASAYDEWRANLTGSGEPQRIDGAQVNVQYFDVFGVRPVAGRFFAADEDRDGNDRVVVLSHGFWTRKFGRDPGIVGNTIDLDGRAHVVVGVAPANFEDPRLGAWAWTSPELWRPLGYEGVPLEDQPSRGSDSFIAVGKLRDGVSREAAAAEVDALMAALVAEYPDENSPGEGMALVPLRETMVREARPSLLVLFAAVGLLLAVAAVNVASLMMSRAADRSRETAVRLALGASRARLLQLHLAEGLLLSAAGGALGVMSAHALLAIFMRIGGHALPRAGGVGVDATVLAFTGAVSILAGMVCGIAPLGRALRTDPQVALRGGVSADADRDSLARRGLVVGEVAIAVILLVGAGLLLRSFAALSAVDLGMNPDDILVFDVSLPFASYSEVAQHDTFFTEVLGRLEHTPGVLAAGTTHVLPLSDNFDSMGAYDAAKPEPKDGEEGDFSPQSRTVMPGYLDAMGMKIVSGRWLAETDTAETEFVVVLNKRFADMLWPGEDPLGRQIRTWREEPLRVVGVVANIKHLNVPEDPGPAMYVALPQGIMPWHGRRANVVVRTAGDPLAVVEAARESVHAVDPNLPVADFRTMSSVLSNNLQAPRFRAVLIGSFAATALLLAALGVYGVVAFHVARQLRNVAIRIALGANAGRVMGHVLLAGLAPVLLGTVVGLAGAFVASRAIESFLFNTAPVDPATFVLVPAILLATATVACWLPARRATRVDPMSTLRDD